jgi:hypothetical protein
MQSSRSDGEAYNLSGTTMGHGWWQRRRSVVSPRRLLAVAQLTTKYENQGRKMAATPCRMLWW